MDFRYGALGNERVTRSEHKSLADRDHHAQASWVALPACLRTLTNLRQLRAAFALAPDMLAALQPLTALTQLHLVGLECWSACVTIDARTTSSCHLQHTDSHRLWLSLVTRPSVVVPHMHAGSRMCDSFAADAGAVSHPRNSPQDWKQAQRFLFLGQLACAAIASQVLLCHQ